MTGRPRLGIAVRLSLSVAAIALAVMVLMIAGIGNVSYVRQVEDLELRARDVEALNVPQLTADVWDYADQAVQEQVMGLMALSHVAQVRLETEDGVLVEGAAPDGESLTRRFELRHALGGRLGELTIVFSLASVRETVVREAMRTSLYVLVPFAAMTLATLLVFRRLVTRHLDALADYAGGLNLDTLRQSFRFARRTGRYEDELDRLLDALDTMRANLLEEITSRRTAETELERTEQKYQQVFDSTGDAIFIHDGETGEILDVNRAMTEMYGVTREAALSSTVQDLSAPVEPFTAAEAARRIERAGAGEPQLFEWLARRRDGGTFWVEVFLKRMEPAEEGRILATVRDIEQRKTAEEQLRHVQRLDSIGQLTGGIAHDFNNMLTGILGAAEMILMDEPAGETRRYAELILDTGRRASDLTAKLLAFSRKGGAVKASIDFHDVVRPALAILERSIDKRIELETDLSAARPVIRGDSALLQSVVLNLGLNARDAMPDGGRLRVSTANLDLDAAACAAGAFDLDPGSYLEVIVADDGVGMDRATLDRALEPFFTTKSVGEGTGLGLSAVYGTMQEHGGAIEIESEPGRGTTVRLLLPAVSGEAAPASTGGGIVLGTGRVLVVEDEAVVRTLAERCLALSGYEVLTATNGQEGVEVFRERRGEIDLVLLDMIMPVMYGYDAFRAIREIDPGARILLASGYSDDEMVGRLMEKPPCGFLKKPYGPVALTRAVADLLNGPAADGSP